MASQQTVGPTPKVLYKKHPLAVRWFHWINFPVLFVMIWSGMLIYWANRVFTFHLFGHQFGPVDAAHKIVPFFPDSCYEPRVPSWFPKFLAGSSTDEQGHPIKVLWMADSRLAEGMAWHFLFAWFFVVNGLLYVLYLTFSREWKLIVPRPRAVLESIQVVLVDLHLSKRKLPVRKYNAAQQIAYTGVILMGILMVLTGIAIYKPSEQSWLTSLLGGYSVAKFIHFWVTMLFLAFFVVHVGQVVRTGWNNFRGMVTGYELVSPDEKAELEVAK